MNNLVGIDTNVLVYATFSLFPKHIEALKIVNEVLSGKLNGVLCWQNLSEYLAVTTNPRIVKQAYSADEAWKKLDKFILAGVKVIYPRNYREVEKVLKYKPAVNSQKVHDLFLAAALMSNGINTLVTENVKDFEGIRNFKAIRMEEVWK